MPPKLLTHLLSVFIFTSQLLIRLFYNFLSTCFQISLAFTSNFFVMYFARTLHRIFALCDIGDYFRSVYFSVRPRHLEAICPDSLCPCMAIAIDCETPKGGLSYNNVQVGNNKNFTIQRLKYLY